MTRMPPRQSSRIAASRGVPYTANPMLNVKLPAWRSRVVLFVLFSAFAALGARALWLQVMTDEFLQQQGESRYARTIELPATRGKILDRNGQVLASSLPVKAVWAIPEDVQSTPREKIVEMARLLGMSQSDLDRRLKSGRSFVYIKRQVENDVADKVMQLGVGGIGTSKEYKRFYPEGEAMAHVVGFTNIEDVGQEGMELGAQKTLVGSTGSRRVIKDRLGRIVEDIEFIRAPHDGRDLTLSIDSKIQYIAYTQLKAAVERNKAKAGGIVVLDAKSGEVLALANVPSFNPNDRRKLTGAQLRNRAITDTFEPGSTLKPFAVALALENKLVTPRTVFNTKGRMTIGTATIGDSKEYESLNVAEIIHKSSNIGTAKMALMMSPQQMWEMFTTLGYGQQPKIGFPGAAAGRVRPYKSWRPIEQATMSYGHGISMSLLQLARSYLVFARNGDIVPTSFFKVAQAPVGTKVFSDKTAQQMRDMMEKTVSPTGTAPQAQVPGYRVGGKTGTSYKLEKGKYVRQYVASFAGIAPMSDPRIVVAVMIDEPARGSHYGGAAAGPVFAAVTENILRTMNVSPDSSVTNIIIPQDIPEEVIG